MKGVSLLLCLLLARDIAGSIFRPQFDPRMANLVVHPRELLSDQRNIEQHQRNRHHQPRHRQVSSVESASRSEDSKEKTRDYDTSSDYHRVNAPIRSWNSALFSSVNGHSDERLAYDDVLSWGGKPITKVLPPPVTNQKDFERSSIFYDSFITMKHMTDEDKNRFHDAYQTAVQTSKDEAQLNAPQLLKKNHYEVEEHTVKTDDGYILTLFHIPAKEQGSKVWADREQNIEHRKRNKKEDSEKDSTESKREESKEGVFNAERFRRKENMEQSNENSREFNREESREKSMERSAERSKEHSRKKSTENSGEKSKEHSGEKSKENSAEKSKERHGEDSNEKQKKHKAPVVFLMHGLFGSADDWLLMGPGKSLAYLLADAGYDVWLGNARGNKYSRRHVSKHPVQPDFWQFTTDEIALHDLPAMIDFVLSKTKKPKLVYVGHSQGTTAFLALTAARPEYNDKIKMMYAISPMVYMENAPSPLLRMIAANYRIHGGLNDDLLGKVEFNPDKSLIALAGGNMCEYQIGCKDTCSNVYFVMAGIHPDNMDVNDIPVIMKHLPAGTSIRQVKQYGQAAATHEFRKYDYGAPINMEMYGQPKPPRYDLSKVKVPVALYYSDNDWLSHPKDVDRLRQELPEVMESYKVPEKQFTQTDFQFSKKAPEVIFERLIKSIEERQ